MEQVGYHNFFNLCAECIQYLLEQIMSHRSRRHNTLETTVDGEDFDNPDYYRKAALAVALLQDNNLLVGTLIYDYPRKLDFYFHLRTAFSVAALQLGDMFFNHCQLLGQLI
jgi:hypothetical protein